MTDTPDFSRQLDARLAPWTKRAATLVRRRIGDAASHAADAVRSAGDSPTAATRSQPFRDAGDRLDELGAELSTLIADARERFVRDAFALWRPHLDRRWYRTDAEPTAGVVEAARGALIYGRTLAEELGLVLDGVRGGLAPAVRRGVAGGFAEGRRSTVELWREPAVRTTSSHVVTMLSDSQVALFYALPGTLER